MSSGGGGADGGFGGSGGFTGGSGGKKKIKLVLPASQTAKSAPLLLESFRVTEVSTGSLIEKAFSRANAECAWTVDAKGTDGWSIEDLTKLRHDIQRLCSTAKQRAAALDVEKKKIER